jgi:hypothetical protein
MVLLQRIELHASYLPMWSGMVLATKQGDKHFYVLSKNLSVLIFGTNFNYFFFKAIKINALSNTIDFQEKDGLKKNYIYVQQYSLDAFYWFVLLIGISFCRSNVAHM